MRFNASTRAALAVTSGLLLALSFPKFDLGFAAWIAFVPLLYAIEGEAPRQVFRLFVAPGLRLLHRLDLLGGHHAA